MGEVHINGGYDAEGVIWHQHSNNLMKKIIEYFDKNTDVIDIGCGHNFYVSVLRYLGYHANGIDLVDLGSRYFYKADITNSLQKTMFSEKCNIISLEVGEHIPNELCEKYLDNITKFKGDIIMSWAVPGQAGIGHINCQSNEWVIDQLSKRGYRIDKAKTDSLRSSVESCHCSWFRNTLMYFTCE